MSCWRTVSMLLPSHSATPLTTTSSRSEDKHSSISKDIWILPIPSARLNLQSHWCTPWKTHVRHQHHLVEAQPLAFFEILKIRFLSWSSLQGHDMPKATAITATGSQWKTATRAQLNRKRVSRVIVEEGIGLLVLFLCSLIFFLCKVLPLKQVKPQ